jgi:uncharacterized SAM-binding protein YcdF (DUF218 family)
MVYNLKKITGAILSFFKKMIMAAGIFFILILVISFTSLPYSLYRNLATSGIHPVSDPDFIVLLGGPGMPSEINLIRAWYAASLANKDSSACLIVALPGNISDSSSSVNLLADELVLRNIPRERILIEPEGTNTRLQALRIVEITGKDPAQTSLVIVTSPTHIYRAVRTFRKLKFKMVGACPAWDDPNEVSLEYNDREAGGREYMLPDVGRSINLRYRWWTHMHYLVSVGREYAAIVYYKLKGWI